MLTTDGFGSGELKRGQAPSVDYNLAFPEVSRHILPLCGLYIPTNQNDNRKYDGVFLVPGSVMMADSLCAMCAAYNWVDCLMRFCYFGPV